MVMLHLVEMEKYPPTSYQAMLMMFQSLQVNLISQALEKRGKFMLIYPRKIFTGGLEVLILRYLQV